jgi:hypothetical protein
MVNQLLAMARAEDQGQVLQRAGGPGRAGARSGARLRAQGHGAPHRPRLRRAPSRAAPRPAAGRAGAAARAGAQPGGQRAAVHAGRRHGDGAGDCPTPSARWWCCRSRTRARASRPAERELVFQPFYRALGTQVDGSGLGLAIVQEIAQRTAPRSRSRTPMRPRHARRAVHGALSAGLALAALARCGFPVARARLPDARAPGPLRRSAQLCISRRLRATDIRMPSPGPASPSPCRRS